MHNDTNLPASGQPSGGVSFGMMQTDIARDPTLPVLVKALYAVLATYANADRECWPSQETLARALGVTDRTVRKAVKQGEAAGLFEVIHTQSSNRYRLRDMKVGGYVVGSGPQTPPGTSVPAGPEADVRADRNETSDEQDQRTRPESQTSSTSSERFTAGGPRTSSQTEQRIEIFVPGSYDTAEAGECSRLLTRSSVKALEAHGYEADADEIGRAVKAAIEASGEKGIDRETLRWQLENTLNLAAGRDPAWSRLIRWDPWESAA